MQPSIRVLQDELEKCAAKIKALSIKDLFSLEANRSEVLSFEFGDFFVDFSKQKISLQCLSLLHQLAEERNIKNKIKRLFKGEIVNVTERRPALHTALRCLSKDEETEIPEHFTLPVTHELARIEQFVDQIHTGQWKGVTQRKISTVVNIGVGGSDLGPRLVCKALNDFRFMNRVSLKVEFVSNMDGTQLEELLDCIDPEVTLFIICSKSFTTQDTFLNVETALKWMQEKLGYPREEIIARHFVGVSANIERMASWGLPEQNRFRLWEWVGGRFSVWSSVGLSIILKFGMSVFKELLAGARKVDCHFYKAPIEENIPLNMALIAYWNTNYLGIVNHAVLPYDGRLYYLPMYLSQLEMESNGKSVRYDGQPVEDFTSPILFGAVGTDAQHAFYQLLHQGTVDVSSDFIACIERYTDYTERAQSYGFAAQHIAALANCLAQSRVLAFGSEAEEAKTVGSEPYKQYRGNQPSTTFLLQRLTPYSLGQLLALYEHKVFSYAVLTGINAFDQWGVELGKRVAGRLQCVFSSPEGREIDEFDPSTNALARKIVLRRTGTDRPK